HGCLRAEGVRTALGAAGYSSEGSVWRVALVAQDAAAADAAASALATACGAVSAFETASGGSWRIEGFAATAPQRALLESALALVWTGDAAAVPELTIDRMPARDWLAENQASFPPLAAGRYFIYGSHYREPVPAGRIGLRIDAATAFGTGEHATTRGCLLALDHLAKRRRPRRVLDMGTGTGILALAAAKTWHRPVVVRDIDAESVRVAARNAAVNGVAPLIAVRRSDGYGDRWLKRAAPFDLVVANILARPLAAMAPHLARSLAPGGVAILSGLLARQERYVLAAHRAQHLVLLGRIAVEGWHTLILTRRDDASPSPPSPAFLARSEIA
ncbi:MAG TPA: 50S ribosomal protein L11 methyltransferase, partial [Stellaceae bacterium]|nr:50S ribosomal protein L11 methyltransferase [Stellaceae bacterium]